MVIPRGRLFQRPKVRDKNHYRTVQANTGFDECIWMTTGDRVQGEKNEVESERS